MKQKLSLLFPLIRIIMGVFFAVVGFGKAVQPAANFQAIIAGYDFLPTSLEHLSSLVMPWVELLLGIFLALGLWLPYVLPVLALFVGIFILIIAQAILRGLGLDDCGCFGELLSVPLHVTILLDVVLLSLFLWLRRNISQTKMFSLDAVFDQNER